MVIALIAGSVITLLALPGRAPVLVTGFEYPKTIERNNDRFAFTLSMIATDDVQNLSVEIGTLPAFSPTYLGLDSVDREKLEEYEPLAVLRSTLSPHGITMTPEKYRVRSGDITFDLVYYDYAPYLHLIGGGASNPNLQLVTSRFAFLHHGDELAYSFKGGPEIFPNGMITISEIRVEVNGKPVNTWTRGDEWAYHMGRIGVGRLSPKDRVDLILYIDGRMVWRWTLLNLVAVSADGVSVHSGAYLINP
jgi:hypothetical protein